MSLGIYYKLIAPSLDALDELTIEGYDPETTGAILGYRLRERGFLLPHLTLNALIDGLLSPEDALDFIAAFNEEVSFLCA